MFTVSGNVFYEVLYFVKTRCVFESKKYLLHKTWYVAWNEVCCMQRKQLSESSRTRKRVRWVSESARTPERWVSQRVRRFWVVRASRLSILCKTLYNSIEPLIWPRTMRLIIYIVMIDLSHRVALVTAPHRVALVTALQYFDVSTCNNWLNRRRCVLILFVCTIINLCRLKKNIPKNRTSCSEP